MTYHQLETAYHAVTVGSREPNCLAVCGATLIAYAITEADDEPIDPDGVYLVCQAGITRIPAEGRGCLD